MGKWMLKDIDKSKYLVIYTTKYCMSKNGGSLQEPERNSFGLGIVYTDFKYHENI